MNEVEAIKNVEDIQRIIDWLEKNKGFRDKVLFVLGINSGLRVSDILNLKIKDVKGKDHLVIREQKTNKVKKFPLKDEVQKLINELCQNRDIDDPLFMSNRFSSLHRSQVYRTLNEAVSELGINVNIGTHSMRKTFGYHHYQQFHDIAILQKIFNHSSPSITLRYIGIEQEEINKSYHGFSYYYDKKNGEKPINYNYVRLSKLDELTQAIKDLSNSNNKIFGKIDRMNRKISSLSQNNKIENSKNTQPKTDKVNKKIEPTAYAKNVVLYLKNYLESDGTRYRAFVEDVLTTAKEMG